MHALQLLLAADGPAPPLSRPERQAAILSEVADLEVYPRSLAGCDKVVYFLARSPFDKHLGLLYAADGDPPAVGDFEGTVETQQLAGAPVLIKLCECTRHNAAALRKQLDFTRPQLLGAGPSIGMGDRLGLATPGHIRAVRGSGVGAVLAQQSIREMTRTGRTPQDVLDDAMWGVFQEGYRDGYAADADHLKTAEDIDACVAAGFTLFTIDPGEHVDDAAATDTAETLREKFARLPWHTLETTPEALTADYLPRAVPLAEGSLEFTEEALLRAAAKYGSAVAHTATLYRHLAACKGDEAFQLEVSVDETATATSPLEHYYVAAELRRMGVRWVSLAPRFVGDFEKGVDYKGSLEAFERSFADHAALARALGRYKLSIHSGSDKFSVYPIAADQAGGLLHVKTAGTSYLEALRTIAAVAPDVFGEILDFACERYEADRATYHVSGDLARVPAAVEVRDAELPHLLEQEDARQVLHVTYGSVLGAANPDGSPRFRARLFDLLRRNEEIHLHVVERHLRRHVEPLKRG